jgi:drug/metabolite transporter (DMT)-like permease
MATRHDDRRLATLGGLGAILLWSTTVALARRLSEGLGPLTAAAAVYGVGGLAALGALAPDAARRGRLRRLPARYLAGCGALFVGYTLLLFLAVGRAESREQTLAVGLVNYLWPVLTILLSVPLLGRRANRLLAPGVVLALAGLVLVVVPGGPRAWTTVVRQVAGDPAAYALAAVAALAWALYSNLTTRWAGGRDEGAVAVFLVAAAVVLTLVSVGVDEPRRWSGRALGEVVFLGLATWSAYGLWDRALRKGDPTIVIAASFLTPLLSTVVSGLYLGVVPGTGLWLGGGLLVTGSLLGWRSVRI